MLEAAWSLSGNPRNASDRGKGGNTDPLLELSAHLPHRRRRSDLFEFVVPLAPTLNEAQRRAVLDLVDDRGGGLFIRVVEDARAALFHARASVVASGTATVEAALMGNPFVVVYRVSPLTYAIARRVVKVAHVAMVNLIAGKRIVPELIQQDFTVANVVQQMEQLLPNGPPRQFMMEDLARIRGLLHRRPADQNGQSVSAINRVAAITLDELRTAPPARNGNSVQA
jgi:lipid-A-disaccharide synthase